MSGGPEPDLVREAIRITRAAAETGVLVRVLGGVAVALQRPAGVQAILPRTYQDLDLVTSRRAGSRMHSLLEQLGYEADRSFNARNGARRLLFHDRFNERQVDVFVGDFEMCHRVPVARRLSLEPVTIPLAELLLTKLQIVELNAKDESDLLELLYWHDVAEGDDTVINGSYVAAVCARDWGLWRTCRLNLERVVVAAGHELPPQGDERIRQRADALLDHLAAAPKSRRWRVRSVIGDRVRWYEEPEEVR